MSLSSVAAQPAGLEQLLGDMRTCAEHLERGQAETPLTEQIETLLRPLPPRMLTFVLAAADAALAARAAAWALGGDMPPRNSDLFEDPLEFHLSAGPDAAEGHHPSAQRIALNIPGARPTTLIVLNLETAQRHAAALMTRMLNEPTVLGIALAPNRPLAPAAAQTLELLATNCCCHVQVNFQDGPGIAPAQLLSGAALEPINVLEMQPPPSHYFDSRSDGLRTGLAKATRLRRAIAIHDILQDREQAEWRLLQSRQKRDQRVERTAPSPVVSDGVVRRAFEALKNTAADEFGRLATALRESGRRAGLRNAEIAGFADELIENIRGDDLQRETIGKKIRLTLRETVADELKERFAGCLKRMIDADVEMIGQGICRLEHDIDQALLRQGIATPGPRLRRPSSEQLWGPIEEGLHIETKFRGELQKRGLLQRFGEGRRVIFLILMMGSLVGGFMGFNIRRAAGMGPIFLLLFLAVVGYTFYS